MYIDETPAISIAAVSNRARRIKRLHGLDMIIVDYIQLMKGTTFNKENRVQEISQITQGLKAIAKEINDKATLKTCDALLLANYIIEQKKEGAQNV